MYMFHNGCCKGCTILETGKWYWKFFHRKSLKGTCLEGGSERGAILQLSPREPDDVWGKVQVDAIWGGVQDWKATPTTKDRMRVQEEKLPVKGSHVTERREGLQWQQALALFPNTQLDQGIVKGLRQNAWGGSSWAGRLWAVTSALYLATAICVREKCPARCPVTNCWEEV